MAQIVTLGRIFLTFGQPGCVFCFAMMLKLERKPVLARSEGYVCFRLQTEPRADVEAARTFRILAHQLSVSGRPTMGIVSGTVGKHGKLK